MVRNYVYDGVCDAIRDYIQVIAIDVTPEEAV